MRTLTKKLITLLIIAIVSLNSVAFITGCDNDSDLEDAAEETGDSIQDAAEETGDTIGEGAEEVGDEVDDAM